MPYLPKARDKRTRAEKNKSWGGDTSFYRQSAWKALRKVVLMENPLCVSCLSEGRTKEAQVVDHIIPVKKWEQGKLKQSNLQGLCHSCHNRKTYNENK